MKQDFPGDTLEQRREERRAKASGQRVETFVANEWTLEFDLAYFGLGELVWSSAELALSFTSGMAAISTSVLAHVKPGDVVLYNMPVYGGTEYLFENILPKFGIEARAFPVDIAPEALEEMARGVGDRVKHPVDPVPVLADQAGQTVQVLVAVHVELQHQRLPRQTGRGPLGHAADPAEAGQDHLGPEPLGPLRRGEGDAAPVDDPGDQDPLALKQLWLGSAGSGRTVGNCWSVIGRGHVSVGDHQRYTGSRTTGRPMTTG